MTDRRRRQLQLAEAARIPSSGAADETLLDRLLELAQQLLLCDRAALLVREPGTEALCLRAARGFDDIPLGHCRIPMEEDLSAQVLQKPRPLLRVLPPALPGTGTDRSFVSEAAVPLQLDDETVGVLHVSRRTAPPLQEADVDDLAAIALQMAAVLCRQRICQHLEERNRNLDSRLREMALAQRFAAQIMPLRTTADLLGDILSICRQQWQPARCAVLLRNAQGALVVRAASGFPSGQVFPSQGVSSRSTFGRVLERGLPLLVADTRQEPDWMPGLSSGRCEMAVPLCVGGQVSGVLGLEAGQPGVFQPDDLALCSVLGTQAAVALQNAGHMDEMQQAATDLRTQVARLEALADVLQQIGLLPNLDDLLRTALSAVSALLHFDACGVFVVQQPSQQLRLRTSINYPPHPAESAPLALPSGVIATVMRTGKPLLVADLKAAPHHRRGPTHGRCELAVPLRVRGRLVGVLDAESQQPQAFGPEELRLMTILAGPLALVIDHSRLSAETSRSPARPPTSAREG